MNRRRFLGTVAGTILHADSLARGTPIEPPDREAPIDPPAKRLAAAGNAVSEPAPFDFTPNLILAPDDPSEWPAFRAALARWRVETRIALCYDDSLIRREDLAWSASAFSCGFVMLCDETFCDRNSGRFTVDRFLDQGEREFGGYDMLILWHAYPRIGLDHRNQFDFYRDAPGGLTALRKLSQACHRRNTRVFLDYNPWDTGTRREGQSDVRALAEMIAAMDADGIFLDTLSEGASSFRDALDAARRGVVLEGEIALPLERIHDHHLSWAQWFHDGKTPGILRNKAFERRHMQHQIHRWNRDHTMEIQSAWMNGSGIMIWENVFGSRMEWNERDRSLLRAILPIQRRYAHLFTGEGWTPLVETRKPDVYAGLWEGDGLRLWTLVNRSEAPVEGEILRVERQDGERCYDLIHGKNAAVSPSGETVSSGASLAIAGKLPPRGVGAFLCGAESALGSGFASFLARQRRIDARSSISTAAPVRVAECREVAVTRRVRTGALPGGMVALPRAAIDLVTEFRVRECGFYASLHEPFAGSKPPPLHQPIRFKRPVTIGPCAIDIAPVTNAAYHDFLKSSGYLPKDPSCFLRHWVDGAPPPELVDHPVVYVNLDDARAFAAWAGKRLPTEEEWQYAAEGPVALRYPWGESMKAGRCNAGETGGTTSVTAFPAGRSPFGVLDMCGNVWEWTESERGDGRTRFAILKGGSYYKATGSDWYFDGGPQPCSFAAKVLLMGSGLDRCATVGFRCAADMRE